MVVAFVCLFAGRIAGRTLVTVIKKKGFAHTNALDLPSVCSCGRAYSG